MLQVDTQPRIAHTYSLQFQLDEKRDDFPCPLRAAMCLLNSFCLPTSALPFPGLSQPQLCLHWSFCLASGTGTFPCLATLQPLPCSFWWLSVGTRTIRQNRKKDERNLDAYVRCEQTDKHKHRCHGTFYPANIFPPGKINRRVVLYVTIFHRGASLRLPNYD